jgi:hypothetical protein
MIMGSTTISIVAPIRDFQDTKFWGFKTGVELNASINQLRKFAEDKVANGISDDINAVSKGDAFDLKNGWGIQHLDVNHKYQDGQGAGRYSWNYPKVQASKNRSFAIT